MTTTLSKAITGIASRAAIAVSICAAFGACSLMMTDVEVGDSDTDADTDSDSDSDTDVDTDTDSDTDTDCTPDAYQQCYGEGEGDVYNFDSCDNVGDLADDCPDVNGTCVEPDATHAECQCLGNWDIATECAQCLGNWDPAAGCASCLSGFGDVDGDDCGTCVRFVDAAATGAGDGLTWATAFTTIQAGIYAAQAAVLADGGPDYCHVWVQMGTYAPTEGSGDDATMLLVDGVRVYGGFSGTALLWADRDPAVNVTTVDGAGVYHVVTGATGAVINGFLITGGNTQSSGGGIDGAGMYNVDASPRVEECTFNDNFSESDGGGMYNGGTAAPLIVGCTFSGNTAESNGAAIANASTSAPTIEDCLFEGNEAASGMGTGNGGAISGTTQTFVTISRCTFRNNLAIEHGGAIYFTAATGSISISDSTFDGNALQFGGGANDGGAVYVNGSTATIDRCVISNNSAPNGGRGGGLYAANSTSTIVNTAFLQNTVGSSTGGNHGGAIYATGGAMTVTNCTLYGNAATASAENLGGGFYLSSTGNVDNQNTIIWGNTPQGIYAAAGGSCSNVYSDLQDGAGNPADNNISSDPVFVGGAPYDLHLQGTSPCIDVGTASGAPTVDLDGTGRPIGDGYDMGAYEQ